MALLNPDTLRQQFEAFTKLPALRQIGVMFGLAASVALGAAIILWAQQPNYGLLYANLAPKDAGQVTQALQQVGIPYRVSPATGAILVPQSDLYQARIRLATKGLPHGTSSGFALLNKQQGLFGFSQFMERIRYNQALQLELERTIASLNSIASDRVHLAIPKQSVFIENSPKPSASVLVNLYPGRTLIAAQVAGVVHLVASSVPGLQPQNVTIVDQQGDLLTGQNGTGGASSGASLSTAQYALTRRLDHLYERRIDRILAPVVGVKGVRAQVTTDLDYALINTTSEAYNPKSQVIRSEQTSENLQWQKPKGGVPGSLTNQPPPAGVPAARSAGKSAGGYAVSPGSKKQVPLVSESKAATKNYEIDRTIQHIQQAPGAIKRISVAVVIDYQAVKGPKGKILSKPLSKQELANITNLVKEAVGFNAARGDTASIINVPFKSTPVEPAISGPPLWQQPWAMRLVKWLLGGVGILILMLGVLRPLLRGLTKPAQSTGKGVVGEGGETMAGAGELDEDRVSIQTQSAERASSGPDYQMRLDNARKLAQEDPKLVAQVVKSWVGDHG